MSILSLHNVSKSFGKTEIIRGVNLDIQAGERHAIIGAERCGQIHPVSLDQRQIPAQLGSDYLS